MQVPILSPTSAYSIESENSSLAPSEGFPPSTCESFDDQLLRRSHVDSEVTISTSSSSTNLSKQTFQLGIDERPQQPFFPGPYYLKNIITMELCERFCYFGMNSLLNTYLQQVCQFNKSSATSVMSIFKAAAYFCPLLGGYLSDSYLGKYRTILYLSIVYSIGMFILSAAAWIENFHIIGFYVAGILISIGTGGIKPCVSAFGADQLSSRTYSVGITHEELEMQTQRYFSLFYMSINFGSIVSVIFIPIVKLHYGFAPAFLIPAVVLVLGILFFIFPYRKYNILPAKGSVLTTIYYAIVVGLRVSREKKNEIKHSMSDTGQKDWIDYAVGQPIRVPKKQLGADGNGLSSEQFPPEAPVVEQSWVDNYKSLIRVFPIMVMMPLFWCVFNQQDTTWQNQGAKMDLLFFTSEQVQVLNPILILILIPLFEKFIYPAFELFEIRCSSLRRMSVGMFIATLAFGASTILQSKLQVYPPQSLSIFYQLPQWILITIAEILVSVTVLEFAYSQATPTMKSTLSAFFHVTTAVGNFLTAALYKSLEKRWKTDHEYINFYYLFTALMFGNSILFLIVAYFFQPVKVKCELEERIIPIKENIGSDVRPISTN